MTTIAEQVGRVVGGRYRLLAPVGAGASSQVFAATDTRLSRRVAVKVLHPMLATDRVFLRRFSAEARLAASLDHPHVMRVFDWGEEAEGPYLVLEYLGGGSLRALLDQGGLLSHSQAASVGAETAAGLAYAHRRGVVHRDVKPSNLLFDEEGHLRIADFGVARALAESAATEPMGAIFGTARYASPEQAEGRALDDRTDVYSLALVLYEALTGRVPFTSDTIAATLMARVGATLPIVSELGPLAPIIAQAAISEPLARLDAAAMCSDLEMLARDLPPPTPLKLATTKLDSRLASARDRDPTVQTPFTRQRGGPPSEAEGLAGLGLAAGADAALGAAGAAAPPTTPAPSGSTRHALSEVELAELLAMSFDEPSTGAGAGAGAEEGRTVPEAPAAVPVPPAHPQPSLQPQAARDVAGAPEAAAPSPAKQPKRLKQLKQPKQLKRPKQLKQPKQPKSPRRSRWKLVAWLVALIVLLGAAGVGGSLAYMRLAVYDHVVPKLHGLQLAAAEVAAHKVGLRAVEASSSWQASVPAGVVLGQSIEAGKHERRGVAVDLSVSKGPKPVGVPNLAHDSLSAAESGVRAGNLKLGSVTTSYSSTVPSGQIVTWTDKGKSVPPGTTINFVMSKGHAPVAVPGIPETDSYTEAAATLSGAGLVPSEATKYSTTVPEGEVVGVSLSGSVPWNSAVVVTVSLGEPFTTVPDIYRYMTLSQAESLVRANGLVPVVVPVLPGGTHFVWSVSPASGTSIRQGQTVDIASI